MSSDRRNHVESWSLGLALLAVAAFFLVYAGDIQRTGLAGNGDPGPKMMPTALAVCLLAAGVYQLIVTAISRMRLSSAVRKPPAKRLSPLQVVGDWGLQNVVLLFAGLCAVAVAMPALGFALTAALFATAMMTRLGFPLVYDLLDSRRQVSWGFALIVTVLVAAVLSTLLVAIIYLLFDQVFDRPLPQGELGLPF